MAKRWGGDRIRRLRYALSLTQKGMADLIGMSATALSNLENNKERVFPWTETMLDGLDADHSGLTGLPEEEMKRFVDECLVAGAYEDMVPFRDLRHVYIEWCKRNEVFPRSVVEFAKRLSAKGIYRSTNWTDRVGLPVWRHVKLKQVALMAGGPPPVGPGPQYVQKGGKLAAVAHVPEAEDDLLGQTKLQTRLQKKVADLRAALADAGNQFGELIRVVDEYDSLLAQPIEDVDVIAIWSVGGALYEMSSAYRDQVPTSTLAPPLEPQMQAALATVTKDHGAFIMGFKEGRALVERADRFCLQTDVIKQIADPGQVLIEELATNDQLVEEATRKVHEAISDALRVVGWNAGRTTYSAYLTIRNAFREILRLAIESPINTAATTTGLLSASSALMGDPNCELVRVAIPVLRDHAAQLLVFFSHSPEFRAYLEYAMELLTNDRAGDAYDTDEAVQ